MKEETLRMLGDDADEDQVSRDVIGLSLGSPGKAFFYLENAKALCAYTIAVSFCSTLISCFPPIPLAIFISIFVCCDFDY